MGNINLGNTPINKIYLGSTEIKSVYLGSTLIWGNSDTPPASNTIYYSVAGAFQNNNHSSYAGLPGTIRVEDNEGNILGQQSVTIPELNNSVGTSPNITFSSEELSIIYVRLVVNNEVFSISVDSFTGGDGSTSDSPKVAIFNGTF